MGFDHSSQTSFFLFGGENPSDALYQKAIEKIAC